MTDFKSYMKMNVYYDYLEKYYKSEDIASIYGVSKFEIKHSNVLSWILQPKEDAAIDYLPIRNLLKLLQQKNEYYDYLNSVDINNALISNVKVTRERYNIDLLITLKINNEDYVIVIENKLESLIHDNQLQVYKDIVLSKYKSYKPLFVFLHPGYRINPEQEQIVGSLNYISITYQGIYDFILSELVEYSNDSETKLIISYYIHCLACYSSDGVPVLIVTDNERKCLKSLFEDAEFNKMLDSLYNNKNNEYTKFYRENKLLFIQIFNKFNAVYGLAADKVREILKSKTYILNNVSYKSIGELLKCIFKTLIETKGYSLEELKDLINLYPESVPLLIEETEIDNLKTTQKSWYLNNPKTISVNGKTYYVLSAWTVKEYEDLKNKVNELRKVNSKVYRKITME